MTCHQAIFFNILVMHSHACRNVIICISKIAGQQIQQFLTYNSTLLAIRLENFRTIKSNLNRTSTALMKVGGRKRRATELYSKFVEQSQTPSTMYAITSEKD